MIWFLAADTPAKTLADNAHDWIPFYGALFITIITAFFNLFKGRSKGKTDQFQAFMDESAEYREELRKEIKELKVEKVILQQQIADYNTQLDNCKNNIEVMRQKLDDSKVHLDLLEEKLRQAQDIK